METGEEPLETLDTVGPPSRHSSAPSHASPAAADNAPPALTAPSRDGHEWRVRLADGQVLGPMPLEEVRQRIKNGEINRDAQVAIGSGNFRPVTGVGQLASLLRTPAENRSQKVAYRKQERSPVKWVVLGVLLLGAVGGGGYYFKDQLFKPPTDNLENVFSRRAEMWRMQFPDLEGTSDDHLARALKAYREDTLMGYRVADEELHKALILDSQNLEAIGAYVENLALLPPKRGDNETFKDAMDGIEYAIKRAPRRPRLYRAQGALLLRMGNVDPAQAALAQALRLEGQDAQAKLWLAQSNLERNTAEAIKLAEEAIQLDADLKRASLVLGQAYQKNGRFKTALNQLRTRLAKDRDHSATLIALARLYVDVGDFAQAQLQLEKVSQLEPKNIAARLLLAKVLYQGLRDFKRAEQELMTLSEAVATEPGDLAREVYSHQAFVLGVRGRWREAEESANRALQDDPNFAPALYVAGRILKQRGATAEAKEKLEKALRGVTGSYLEAPVRTLLADTLVEQGQHMDALRHYSHTIQHDPRYMRAHLGLGALHAVGNNMQHAATVMREVLNIDPFYGADHFFFTDYPELPEDLMAYRQAWAKLKADENDRTLVLSSEGITAFHAGQYEDAIRLLTKSQKEDPNNLGAAMYLGAVHLARRDGKAAQKAMEKAVAINKLHVRTQYLQGRALQLNGQLEKAETKFKEVREADPSSVAALNAEGEVLLKKGQEEQARELFLEAFRADVDFTTAKANLLRANY